MNSCFLLLLLAAILIASSCRADSAPPAKEHIGSSSDGRYIVRIAAQIQVFSLDKEEKSYRLVSAFDAASEGTPLKALISDDGKYVVTLDGGRSMGRGADVVAVFDSGGKKLKSWSLNEILTKEDRSAVPLTVSSDWWRQEARIAFMPPQLIIVGPSKQFDPAKRQYWYQLDFRTLKWEKKR